MVFLFGFRWLFFHGQQSFAAFGRRRLALGLLLGSDATYYLQWKVGGHGTICIYQVWSLILSLFHAFRHFYLLWPLRLTFGFWVFLFMHWRRSTSFQLPTTLSISSSVFIVLAASLCIGLIFFFYSWEWSLSPHCWSVHLYVRRRSDHSSHAYLSCLCMVVGHNAEINKASPSLCEEMRLIFERNISRPSEANIVLTYEVAIYESLGC